MLKYITPRIRFQEFDSWWETIKLTDLGISVGGTAIESEFDPDGKYKVISIGSYSEESKYKDQGIRAIYSKKTEKRILEKDDLTMILNDKTSTGKIIGRVLLIDEDNSYVYNQRTQRICLDKNKYVPDFIFQLLNADINRNKIVRSAQGNTQIYVNWSDISNLDYLIPDSFDEQSAIGSLFRTLDDLLASYKDNLANYQSLKATMLSKMFSKAGQTVPEIRLDGFEGEWKKSKLKDVAHRVQGNDGRMDLPTLTISASGGWMNQIERFSANIAGKEQKNYTLLKKGELSYNHGNSKLAKYGVVFELQDYEEALVPKVYHSFRVNQLADAKFIEIMFSTKIPDRELGKLVSSGARMDGLLNISFDDFMNIAIIIPTIEEQQAIGAYFSNLDNLISSNQEKISHLETLKKKLLQDMFI